MKIRFRRSLSLFPGVKLHFGTRGVGISAGVRGAHVGINSRRSPYVSAGLPGSGLYVVHSGSVKQNSGAFGWGVLGALLAIVAFVLWAVS